MLQAITEWILVYWDPSISILCAEMMCPKNSKVSLQNSQLDNLIIRVVYTLRQTQVLSVFLLSYSDFKILIFFKVENYK